LLLNTLVKELRVFNYPDQPMLELLELRRLIIPRIELRLNARELSVDLMLVF
jgi:hypothetical protein